MRKLLATALSISLVAASASHAVAAATLNYRTAINKIEAKGSPAVVQYFEDGKGNQGKMVAYVEEAYSSSASLKIRDYPNADAQVISRLAFGSKVKRVGLCDNGWSKVLLTLKGKKTYGYTESYYLSSEPLIDEIKERLEVKEETEVLNFPGTRDGLSVGELSVGDRVTCTGMCSDNWSRITYKDDAGKKITGFVQNSVLSEIKEKEAAAAVSQDYANAEWAEGMIEGEALIQPPSSSSDSESIWAKAATENLQEATEAANALVINEGDAENVSTTAKLERLGEFRITHYCACSICCGPYSGMNSTASGVAPVTNHTIAVDPTQIPYGTKVVINGQVYVAEDCGGGIKTNCIDIYVASHDEACAKGMYYADVYLLEE